MSKNADEGRGIVNATCGSLRDGKTPTHSWIGKEMSNIARASDRRGLSWNLPHCEGEGNHSKGSIISTAKRAGACLWPEVGLTPQLNGQLW